MKKFKFILIFALILLVLLLVAACSQQNINIYFNTIGGDELDYMRVSVGSVTDDLPVPEKKGFIFDGWYYDQEYTKVFNKNSIINDSIESNITVYAKWLKTFIVIFDSQNGSAVAPIIAKEGVFSLPREPQREGYVFEGWYLDKSSTTRFEQNSIISSDITLYANWIEDRKYTVLFYDFNNELLSTQEIEPLGSAIEPELEENIEYYLLRWDLAFTRVTKDLSIRPIKIKKNYTVNIYDINKELIASTKTAYGNSVSLDNNRLKKQENGYKLENYLEDKTGEKYSFDTLEVKQNYDLYLVYSLINYRVTYHLNGGLNHIDNPTTITKEDIVTFKDPSKNGCNFEGWYMITDGKEYKVPNSARYYINLDLYAKWNDDTYSIYYMDEKKCIGYENLDNGRISSGIEAPKKDFYTFSGWYKEPDFKTVFSSNSSGETVYAYSKWEIKDIRIEYVIPEGINVNNIINPIVFNIDKDLFLDTPIVQEFYLFNGWYLDEGFTKPITRLNNETITELEGTTIKLYAKIVSSVQAISYSADLDENRDKIFLIEAPKSVKYVSLCCFADTTNEILFNGYFKSELRVYAIC